MERNDAILLLGRWQFQFSTILKTVTRVWLVSPHPTGKPHETGIGGINPIEVDTRIVCTTRHQIRPGCTIIQVEYPEGCAVAMILRAWSMMSWRFSAGPRASRAVEASNPVVLGYRELHVVSPCIAHMVREWR